MSHDVRFVVRFVPQPRDFAALLDLGMRRGPFGRHGRLIARLLGAGIFTWAAATTRWPGDAWWPVPVAAGLGLLLGGAVVRWTGWIAWRLAARLQGEIVARQARRDGLLVPQTITITPQGLRATSEQGETLTLWSAVRDVVRTEDHVVVFITPRLAFLAPRRAFGSRADFDAFGAEAEALYRAARPAA